VFNSLDVANKIYSDFGHLVKTRQFFIIGGEGCPTFLKAASNVRGSLPRSRQLAFLCGRMPQLLLEFY
jgi:hypothetical protein